MPKLRFIALFVIIVITTSLWGVSAQRNSRLSAQRNSRLSAQRNSRHVIPATACQRHQEYPNKTGIMMDVQCKSNGDYKRMQCSVGSPKVCGCFKKSGEATSLFSTIIKSCKCFAARKARKNRKLKGCHRPQCELNGYYRLRTCCERRNPHNTRCWCHDPTTGEKYAAGSIDTNCESVTKEPITTETGGKGKSVVITWT